MVCDNLHNSQEWFSGFFVVRAHSSFLGAVTLLLGGQIPEAYACLRLVLENSLYGFYLSKNPASRETWLRRSESDAAKKKVRDEFKYGHMLKTLKSHASKEGNVASILYEHTIDCGAHPNEEALIQVLTIKKGDGKREFQMAYIIPGNSPASLLALKRAAQTGVCALNIFQLVYKERFDLLGLTDMISRLKKGL
jgi:hypothetical protein